MTVYGWDLSSYDWPRGPVDMALAARQGISFATHKVSEGLQFADPQFPAWWKKAHGVIPLCGGYHVLSPGYPVEQADRFMKLLDGSAPGWRDGPFLLQIDAEKFAGMTREPSHDEIKMFADRLVAKTGGTHRPVVYGPHWLYGERLVGIGYPLWSSAYVNAGASSFAAAYPGDSGSGWSAYSGQTPAIWQYASTAAIAGQHPCDANAHRGTLPQLINLVYPGGAAMPLTDADKPIIQAAVTAALAAPVQLTGGPATRLGAAGWNTNVSLPTMLGYVFEFAVLHSAVDPAPIAAAVLAQLSPQQIATAVIAALPAGLARAEAVELARIITAGAALPAAP